MSRRLFGGTGEVERLRARGAGARYWSSRECARSMLAAVVSETALETDTGDMIIECAVRGTAGGGGGSDGGEGIVLPLAVCAEEESEKRRALFGEAYSTLIEGATAAIVIGEVSALCTFTPPPTSAFAYCAWYPTPWLSGEVVCSAFGGCTIACRRWLVLLWLDADAEFGSTGVAASSIEVSASEEEEEEESSCRRWSSAESTRLVLALLPRMAGRPTRARMSTPPSS
jgi:hypothetical protein